MPHPMHIVAVGGLVEREDGQVLLVRSFYRGWEFPGGQAYEGKPIRYLERYLLPRNGGGR